MLRKIKRIFFKVFNILIWIYAILCIAFIIMVYKFPFTLDQIKTFLTTGVNVAKIAPPENNEYFYDYDFMATRNVSIMFPGNKPELVDTIRTGLNSGADSFVFYCNPDYDNCFNDLELLSDKNIQQPIAYIYAFNHPFNDYESFTATNIGNYGLTIDITKRKYTPEQIEMTQMAIDDLYLTLYDKNKSVVENILIFNNWLRENVSYDQAKADEMTGVEGAKSPYNSNIAYGALYQGKAICSGYTDAMFLYIEKLGLKQMRVVGINHIWNAVEINGKWYQIDVTWNDFDNEPNQYFMLTTKELLAKDKEYHTFADAVWPELIM